MISRTTWYADGLRWVGTLLTAAADFIDRETPEPMPRHISGEEILSETRNRLLSRSMASP